MRGVPEGAPVVVVLQGAEGAHRFRLELAEGRREQERGLMHRRAMHPDYGMVFPYADEAIRSFWMANTLISLDMLFINGNGQVVTIVHEAEPLTRSPRTSTAPARFVVELVGGTAARLGIEEGTEVQWEGLPERWRPATP